MPEYLGYMRGRRLFTGSEEESNEELEKVKMTQKSRRKQG